MDLEFFCTEFLIAQPANTFDISKDYADGSSPYRNGGTDDSG